MEVNKIKEDFDKVITYSQGIKNPKTDRLFKIWEEKKKYFIRAFGNKLIYELPFDVSFEIGEKEKHDRIMRFADQVDSQWGYSALAQFIEKQEAGFFDNLTVADYEGWDGKTIHKGTKLVKAFNHFIKDNDRSLFDIQNEASRIIQEDKIKGTLCLSVHPLDFLSLSENTYNWRSCHALDGEYRAGNLSYMMDECTVICYLKGADDATLNGFGPEVKWNSKKWRVLLYFSKDKNMIIAGRQYPFESASGMNTVLNILLPSVNLITSDGRWTGWESALMNSLTLDDGYEVKFYSRYLPIEDELIPIDDIFSDAKGSKQFDDVLSSSCYSPIYAFKYTQSWMFESNKIYPATRKATTTFEIGNYTYCLQCGKEECLFGADSMMCENCELTYGQSENEMFCTCDCCGRRIFTDDATFIENSQEYVCEDCLNKYYQRCECCGDWVPSDYIKYSEITQQYVCSYCLNDINEGEFTYG